MLYQWPLWLSYNVAQQLVTRWEYRIVAIRGVRVLQPGPSTIVRPGAVRGSGPAYVRNGSGWSYLYDMLTCSVSL